ncbi:MAG: Na+/H+ antiporter subunit E [Alkalimonas sp.]|nr:Na+/H+ antiporter subunit E [Alkalimonas sp.]
MKNSTHHPRKFLPHPRFTAFLLVLWLLMVESLATSQILLGLGLAWLIPFSTQQFWVEQSSMHHPLLMLRYAGRFAADIFRSNLLVAWQIIRPIERLQPGFVSYPLSLRDDFAITILASTITLTPGTVSAHISRDKKTLLLHVLNLKDEAALIAEIAERYEKPLKEIFQC